jgi:hypothetical protein
MMARVVGWVVLAGWLLGCDATLNLEAGARLDDSLAGLDVGAGEGLADTGGPEERAADPASDDSLDLVADVEATAEPWSEIIDVEADLAPCETSDPCQVAERGSDGICELRPLACASPSACHVARCDPAMGCVLGPLDCTGCIYADACADDDPCTEGLCWFGHCAVTTLPWCG